MDRVGRTYTYPQIPVARTCTKTSPGPGLYTVAGTSLILWSAVTCSEGLAEAGMLGCISLCITLPLNTFCMPLVLMVGRQQLAGAVSMIEGAIALAVNDKTMKERLKGNDRNGDSLPFPSSGVYISLRLTVWQR